MTTPEPDVSAMRAVTISREYGSGGGEIAARLAVRLGWRLVDHEVVTQIAQRLGVEVQDAEAHDEHAEGWVVQFFTTMQTVGPMVALPSNFKFPPNDASYTRALREIVLGATQAGHSVIIGRGSQMILRDRLDTLHVRIIAPLAQRIAYVAQRESLSSAAAQQRIQQKDLDRRRYLATTYHRMPDEALLYDLVLNTGAIDLDGCVDLVIRALANRATRVNEPMTALGPMAPVTRYTEPPADFEPPIAPSGAPADNEQTEEPPFDSAP